MYIIRIKSRAVSRFIYERHLIKMWKFKRLFAKKTANITDPEIKDAAEAMQKLEKTLPNIATTARKLNQLLKDYDAKQQKNDTKSSEK